MLDRGASWFSSRDITLPFPVSILHKSIAGRYRPVRVADGPITARCRFLKNASWVAILNDLPERVDSQIRLFSDECLQYRPINSPKDHLIL